MDGFRWDELAGPTWIGVVNVTPNSFSDGGMFLDAAAAAGRVGELVRAGAGIVELGAEASSFFRPGVEAVSGEEQWGRLEPILKAECGMQNAEVGGRGDFKSQISDFKERPILAVDTRSAWVARQALGAGVGIVNDISAGTFDGGMLETVAELGGAVVLMHIGASFPGNPAADVPGIVERVREYLAGRVLAAERAGVRRERIAVDPGIGFGKTMGDNWRLAMGARELEALGCAVVLGVSRKRFLATDPPGGEVAGEFAAALGRVREILADGGVEAEHERDAETAAATLLALRCGIRVHRVHNVRLCAAVLRNEPRRHDGTTS